MKERGDDHPLIDIEVERAEPRFARQVGRRHALVDAPGQQVVQSLALGQRQRRVQEWIEAVQRQVQCVQQQVRGLVVRAGGPVAEGKAGCVEARYRIPQPVAQRAQFVDRGGHQGTSSCSSTRR